MCGAGGKADHAQSIAMPRKTKMPYSIHENGASTCSCGSPSSCSVDVNGSYSSRAVRREGRSRSIFEPCGYVQGKAYLLRDMSG